jgi:hypothetical protein
MARPLTSSTVRLQPLARQTARARAFTRDRASLVLVAVFLCMSVVYVWMAAESYPLALHGSSAGQYNALADAFLHLRLWIARFPGALLGPEPLNPALKPAVLNTYGDDSLYRDHLYLSWGPAPVLVLLVPLHLLGYEPSGSVIIAPFAIVGLGFALAALRVSLKLIAEVPLWMCTLAAVTLACASVMPELLRGSEVYHEAIAGGYCFTMAGIWLAASAIVDRRASLLRLGVMSLCFGLATGSRPTLGLTVLVLVPVFASLKSTRPRRGLLVALTAPVGACLLLLAVYNYARYGNPLEIGTRYQIGSLFHAHLGEVDYVPIGMWSYVLTPPRLGAVFPFLSVAAPQLSYPLNLPVHYAGYSEKTGGLLPMTPIVIFLVALPWMWRRRPALLGSLGPLLLAMASAGVGILLILSYELYVTSERYEADYATLLVFGALVVWLALSAHTRGSRQRVIRVGGGLLAVWSCMTGAAVGSQGLQKHARTWRTLVSLGSPLSTAIVAVGGHPILAEVYAANVLAETRESYSLDTAASNISAFWLGAGEQATLTVVSPDSRNVTLIADVRAGSALSADARLEARISGPGPSSHIYQLPAGSGEVGMVVHLARGVNQLALSPVSVAEGGNGSRVQPPVSEPGSPLMLVSDPHLAGG